MSDASDLAGYASLGSGLLSAFGALSSGSASSAAAKYNAAMARNNAAIATQKAGWAGAEGEQAYGLAGLQGRYASGSIKAAQGGNGVDVNSGSALAVQKGQQEMNMLNLSNIRSNAARQAYGYETQAASDLGQANLDEYQAKHDKSAGFTNAATNMFKGVAQYAMFTGGNGPINGDTSGSPVNPNYVDPNAGLFSAPSTGYLNTSSGISYSGNSLFGP